MPPSTSIRPAVAADATVMADLLTQLGYPAKPTPAIMPGDSTVVLYLVLPSTR